MIRKAEQLWKMSLGVRRGLICNILSGMLSVALSLTAVWLMREIVSTATTTGEHLDVLSMLLCGALLLRLTFAKSAQRVEAWCITRQSNRMRSELFATVMDGECCEKEMHSADVVNRLSGDVGSVTSTLCSTLPSLAVTAVSLVASFIFLFTIAPALAVAITLLMPMAIFIGKISMKRSHRLTAEIRNEESGIYRQLQENISHRLLVATLGYDEKAKLQFEESQNRFFRLTMKRNDLGLYAGGAVTLGFMAGYAIMFLYCAYGLRDGSVSFATMTALLQLVAMVQRPAVEISHKISPLVRGAVAMDRLDEIRDIYRRRATSAMEIADVEGICLQHIWFRYDVGGEYVLKDYTETIPIGEITVIYGATGRGKTTIFRLLLGLYRAEKGNIRSPFAIGTGNVVYIPQGNSLMSGTIQTNLMMGKPDAERGEMEEALRIAAADFVDGLPLRLQTPCGESGAGLSEGQAQRIAIARGILRLMALRKEGKQNILFMLDEPSSALDEDTERKLCERLMRYLQLRGVTTIVITHRPVPAEYARKRIEV